MKNNAIEKVVKTARQTIQAHGMVEKLQSILVGVSGGPDSIALLLLLDDLQKEFSLSLGVAHVNHGLRGKDADCDQEFVRELAQNLNLPFFIHKADIRSLARKQGLSLEEAGRDERYRFFRSICQAKGYEKVALAHTKNDNAEQVLINLLRGSGPRGLSGIPFVRDDWIIRPFLDLVKEELLAFLRARDQAFQIDESNFDDAFLRNRIRNNLLPHLANNYNPSISDTLNRLSRILGEEDAFMEIETQTTFNQTAELVGKDEVWIPLKIFQNLHPALARRVARHAVELIKGDLRRITFFHMDAAIALASHSSPGGSLDFPDRIRVFKKKGIICFKKEQLPLREVGRLKKFAKSKDHDST